ncbi:Hermansky-Pudlak syndrome 5 protein-like [Hippocampus comes]|uniref:Hermansky-Pudlak syndrome 5 protein-like n=1 Tax=Hippocampus comes TaxID=109280 RepID=UPI00094EAF7D|nr:PREDICTED: Hermansky-Pudlak syndrome 5 protein-like [Hippocampus comes]
MFHCQASRSFADQSCKLATLLSGETHQRSPSRPSSPTLSVSSFVKKTTEKINTLQMNSELWQRPDLREGIHAEMSATSAPFLEDADIEVYPDMPNTESELLELQSATEHAM